MSYDPVLAARHTLSTTLRSSGGLLGTYFSQPDFTGARLGNDAHLNFPYHEPKWCPDSLTHCDSTRLDATLDFAWGDDSPLEGIVPANSFQIGRASCRERV